MKINTLTKYKVKSNSLSIQTMCSKDKLHHKSKKRNYFMLKLYFNIKFIKTMQNKDLMQ